MRILLRRRFSVVDKGLGVARGEAEQAGENRESSHPVSPAGVQIRVDKEDCHRFALGRRRTGRPSPGKRSSGKRISRATIEELGEARIRELEGRVYGRRSETVGLARARIRRGARSGRALGDSSRGVGDMGEAAWRGWKPGRKWRICPKRSRRVPAAAGPWIRFRGPMTPRWWRSRPGSMASGDPIGRSSLYYTPKGESAESLALMQRIDELFLEASVLRSPPDGSSSAQGLRLCASGTIAGGLSRNCSRLLEPVQARLSAAGTLSE